MNRCPFCQRSYEGLAAACPRCGKDLPPSGLIVPTPPERAPSPRRRTSWALGIGLLVTILVFFPLEYVNALSHFCIDMDLFGDDGVDQCAEERAASFRWMIFAVIPASLLAGITPGFVTDRVMRRRERHRRTAA